MTIFATYMYDTLWHTDAPMSIVTYMYMYYDCVYTHLQTYSNKNRMCYMYFIFCFRQTSISLSNNRPAVRAPTVSLQAKWSDFVAFRKDKSRPSRQIWVRIAPVDGCSWLKPESQPPVGSLWAKIASFRSFSYGQSKNISRNLSPQGRP